jgi:hypothetical protein
MLLDDDVVADGEAQPGTFAGRFRREERVEHLFFHVRWNTGAIVADPDFHNPPRHGSSSMSYSNEATATSNVRRWTRASLDIFGRVRVCRGARVGTDLTETASASAFAE